MRRGPKPRPVADRLWAKVAFGDWLDCWLWTAKPNRQGYGELRVGSEADGSARTETAHRLAYELLVGPIPEGLELDHICHNIDATCPGGPTCPHRACLNPLHLEPVTHAENVRRGRGGAHHAAKTHCVRGHEFNETNTRIRKQGGRECRACERARYHERKKSLASYP